MRLFFLLHLLRRLIVVWLIRPHGAGRAHGRDRLLTILRVLEHQQEAVFDHLLGGGCVIFNARGHKEEVGFRTEVANCGDKHEGAEIFHAAALVEKDAQGIGEVRVPILRRARRHSRVLLFGRRGSRRSGRLPSPLRLALNFGDQAINICKKAVDIFIKGLSRLDLIDLRPEVVDGLEHQVEQRGTVFLRHDGHRVFSYNKEKILDAVRDRRERIKLHHGRGALDGVHDAEDLVHIVLRKGVRLFRFENNALKLLKQRIGFVDISIEDFVSTTHGLYSTAFLTFLFISTRKGKKISAAVNFFCEVKKNARSLGRDQPRARL